MQFNPAAILASQPAQDSVELLPPDRYLVVNTGLVPKPSKNNPANIVLHGDWTVVLPEKFKGRKLKSFFNIKHSTPMVEQSGQINLAQCAGACGLGDQMIGDITTDLIGRRCVVRVDIKPKSESYPYDSNVIRQWLKPTNQAPAPAPVMPVPVMPTTGVNLGAMADDIPF